MIRKSHSWSLTWTRDKSADQCGPSIDSLPSGQSQSRQSKHWQAHSAGAGCISRFELRTSYLPRRSSIPALKSDHKVLAVHPRCLRYGRRNLSSSSLSSGVRASVPSVYCIPPLVSGSESVFIRVTTGRNHSFLRGFLGARLLFRFNDLTFQRFNVLVAALPRWIHPWFHSFAYALSFRFSIARHSTSVHERSTCVHEQSLDRCVLSRHPNHPRVQNSVPRWLTKLSNLKPATIIESMKPENLHPAIEQHAEPKSALAAPTASSPHSAMASPSVVKDSPSVEQSALRNDGPVPPNGKNRD